jgi:hypothetical protein
LILVSRDSFKYLAAIALSICFTLLTPSTR